MRPKGLPRLQDKTREREASEAAKRRAREDDDARERTKHGAKELKGKSRASGVDNAEVRLPRPYVHCNLRFN